MLPSEATTPDELLQALLSTDEEMPLVPISVLVEAMGELEAKKLIKIDTHKFVNRIRAVELIVLQRAMQQLSPEQRALLLPNGIENPNGTKDQSNPV